MPGRPKKICAVDDLPFRGIWPKTSGLPGWMRTPVKWKLCAEAGEGGFDEVEFASGDAAGDEKHVGFQSLRESGVEGFGGVGGGGEDDGFGAGVGDECGEHGGVGIADFAGAGRGVDRNEFVAGGEDGDAGTDVDVEVRVSAGGGEGDLGGGEPVPAGSCSSPRRACAPLATMLSPGSIVRGGTRRTSCRADLSRRARA